MRTIQFREALREAMSEEMRRDPSVFLMGEEVAEYNGAYKVSQGMLDEFGPERVIDTPIAELGFAGIGVGAAANGLKPIIEFMTFNFSLVAIDQVINSAAKLYSMSGGQYSCPIVFRGPTGNAGMLSSQHSQNFENWYANCPGLKVVVPSNPYDAKGLMKAAIRDPDPVIFMESELMYGDKGEVPEEEYILEIGKANVVTQGTDDYDTLINSVKKTNRLVVIEEAWPLASISGELAYMVQRRAFDYLDAPVVRITCADVPLPYAPTLIEASLPNVARILKAVKEVTYAKV
jgi:pyruvate dehydrogenase E1 component beta subunit